MAIRVYINTTGSKFIKAENDEYFQKETLENLANNGIHLYLENDDQQTEENDEAVLKDAILSLPLKKQVQLANLLLENNGFDFDKFSLKIAKDKYQRTIKHDDPTAEFNKDNFLIEFHTGEKGILSGIDQMFADYDSDEMELVLNFLDDNLSKKHWRSWTIIGYSQGDEYLVWTYQPKADLSYFNRKDIDDYTEDFWGKDMSEQLVNLLFGSVTHLVSCDNHGKELTDPKIDRRIGGYTVTNSEDSSDLDKYMANSYNLKPAEVEITYYAKQSV